MVDSFNYALKKREDGAYVIQSTVSSFNLNQVVEKDIVSFYKHFSSSSSIDTGLLPLDGTGVLSIRSAGHHMQITVQHKPGTYHINWGDHEGDRHANTFYLAQPYRIVIGDFVNGNLLGARMFYSPYPITHPGMPLYHVNLPNINCKGYRGNGVGWICLYLKEDWSTFSFNEKVSRLIERCSGVETYNDANMSETDGPRFYEAFGKPNYTYNPQAWQKKTEFDGFDWTLDPDLWIPVKVEGIDSQGSHNEKGVPLTLSMALLGNYQAYYTDKEIPKLYNILAREDLNFSNDKVASMFKSSFASAPAVVTFEKKDNPFQFSDSHREAVASKVQPQLSFDDEQDESEDNWICYSCEEVYDGTEDNIADYDGNTICSGCTSEHYVYIESVSVYYPSDHMDICFADNLDCAVHIEHDTWKQCEKCQFSWGAHGQNKTLPIYNLPTPYLDDHGNEYNTVCAHCITSFVKDQGYEDYIGKCYSCETTVIKNCPSLPDMFYTLNHTTAYFDDSNNLAFKKETIVSCATCIEKGLFSLSKAVVCPCGALQSNKSEIKPCVKTTIIAGKDSEIKAEITECCAKCIGNLSLNSNGILEGEYVPFSKELSNFTIENAIPGNSNSMVGISVHIDYDKVQF